MGLAVVIVILPLIPRGTSADPPSGQSWAYVALRADADRCNVYAPQFAADTAVLFNGTSQSTTVNTEMWALDTRLYKPDPLK